MTHLSRGYAALITTLFLCAVLTALSFSSATRTYLLRLSALRNEDTLMSRARAYSCVQVALFEISADQTYRPHEDGEVADLSADALCTIESITEEGSLLRIVVQGEHEDSITRLEVFLEELPGLRPPFRVEFVREI